MSPVDAVRSVLRNYVNFTGRARRSEYWWFVVAVWVVMVILWGLFAATKGSGGIIALMVIVYLAVLLPALSVLVRRLHDTGRSGVWFFISFVPFVGGIILLVLTFIDSQPGANQWGVSAKYPNGPTFGGGPGSMAGGPYQPGYPQPGYAQPGYAQPGYAQPGYPQGGHGQPGYPPQSVPQGYPPQSGYQQQPQGFPPAGYQQPPQGYQQ